MSPSEEDLRAALHQGEGLRPDVNRILAAGQARRAQRRNLVTAVAAGVLIIGGVTAGVTALGNGGPDTTSSAKDARAADSGAANNRPVPVPSPSASTAPGAGKPPADSRATACPTRFPSPTRAPSDPGSPLFADAVRSVVVCAYGSDLDIAAKAAPARQTVSGSDAANLAASLESARKTAAGRTCLPARTLNLVLIPTSESGRTLPTVSVTYSGSRCDGRVTNGTALRYGWSLPAGLLKSDHLSPSASGSTPTHSPGGKSHGPPPTR